MQQARDGHARQPQAAHRAQPRALARQQRAHVPLDGGRVRARHGALAVAGQRAGEAPVLLGAGGLVGGGLPAGAFLGTREVMERLAPLGPVYQAGTLSGYRSQPRTFGGLLRYRF